MVAWSWCAAGSPQVRIIRLPENHGPGPAREAGLRAVDADLVGFVDNDVVPMPDCFQLLAAALTDAGGATLAMPRVVHADEPRADPVRGRSRALHRPDGPGGVPSSRSTSRLRRRARSARSSPPVSWSTAAAGARAQLQDPSFFMYHEDHDLGLRAGQLGHRIVAVPRALCRHGKGTPGLSARRAHGYTPRRVVFMIANRWRILLTRYELRTLILLAPSLLIFELCQLAGAIAKGWTGELGARPPPRSARICRRSRASAAPGRPSADSATAIFLRAAPCPSTRASLPAAWSGGSAYRLWRHDPELAPGAAALARRCDGRTVDEAPDASVSIWR